ncbi:putative UAA transporter family [Paratrimastix pyriformis]|uniref:UAA transporter family n=1 Tax=Paratrimastix pyriformis TaxID=342808 RepID=A0ABQ8UZJ9_9EUKA|nr:putative UAA transporter family [Paratrimastix pyriformis]
MAEERFVFLLHAGALLAVFSLYSALQESAMRECSSTFGVEFFLPILENLTTFIVSLVSYYFAERTRSSPMPTKKAAPPLAVSLDLSPAPTPIPSKENGKSQACIRWKIPLWLNHVLAGTLFAISHLTSYHAYHYLPYPILILAKSTKLLLSMPHSLLSGKRYTRGEWTNSGLMCVGLLAVFFKPSGSQTAALPTENPMIGMLLLFIAINASALVDELQNQAQAQGCSNHLILSAEMGLAALVNTSYVVATGALGPIVAFTSSHLPWLAKAGAIALLNVLGQNLFLSFKRMHGTWWKNAIATLRKCVTLLLSLLIYGHQVTPTQAFGMAVVFLGTAWATQQEMRKAP